MASREMGPGQEFSDPEGRACLVPPWTPPWIVSAKAPGYAMNEVRLVTNEETEIRLEREAVLLLTARTENGEPVTGARVFLEPAGREPKGAIALPDEFLRMTDASGVARFDGLMAARYRAHVEATSFLNWLEEVSVERPEARVTAVLLDGARVAVRVAESAGDRSIPDAVVQLDPRGQAVTHPLACRTQGDGRCVIKAVPPGMYEAQAAAPGTSIARQTLGVAPGAKQVSLELLLPRGIRLTGTVSEVEQYPGIELAVVVGKPTVPMQQAPLGPDGRFALNQAPTGSVRVYVVESKSRSMLTLENIEVPDNVETFDVTIELPEPARLHGTIRRGGTLCVPCTVRAARLGAEVNRPRLATSTLPDGSYQLRLPSGGRYAITIDDGASPGRLVDVIEVSGDVVGNYEIEDTPLRGQVTSASGDGAGGAIVELYHGAAGLRAANTIADDNGRFAFRGMAPGEYRVTATKGGAAATADVRVAGGPRSEVALRLGPEYVIRLRLLDAVTGLPVLRATARLYSASGEVIQRNLSVDPSGVATMPAFGLTAHTLVVDAWDYAIKTVRDIVPSDTPRALLLLAGRSFSVELASLADAGCLLDVRDASDQPIALAIEHRPGPVPITTRAAVYNTLEPGPYTVSLQCAGAAKERRSVVLAPGRVPTLRFGPGTS